MSERAERGFDSLLTCIEQELDFESGFYNNAYLDRRINVRMRRTGHDEYRAYQRYMADDAGEREALLDSLSINVTAFFRNPEAWASLRGVLADLTADHRRVRVWSAPCADGCEPYSVAMLALDDYDPYIEREGDAFCVRDRVKDLVEFERHDLIRGEDKRDFDRVLCRNLLIYIDSDYKVPVFETITGSLKPERYLMIGMTETLPAEFRDRYEPVAKNHRIYRRS